MVAHEFRQGGIIDPEFQVCIDALAPKVGLRVVNRFPISREERRVIKTQGKERAEIRVVGKRTVDSIQKTHRSHIAGPDFPEEVIADLFLC